MRRHLAYNEDGEEQRYISRNRRYFITPFEARAEYLGMLREKARHRLQEPGGQASEFARKALEEYHAQTNDEIEVAIGDDLESFRAFQDQVSSRIVATFKSGQLTPLRCPACNRITFTTETRQCVWCGHNWHETK